MSTAKFDAHTTAEVAAIALSSQIAGKTILVTGVSPGGLGFEAVRAIAKAGVGLVIITGRSQSKLDLVQKQLLEIVPSANIRLLSLDLASRESIRTAATEVLTYKEPCIDVLINNASVLSAPYALIDAVESTLAVSHIGPFLFTSLILPKIMASPEPRIVNVGSAGHQGQAIRFGDLTFKDGAEYDPFKAYSQAKTANTLFAVELAHRYGARGLLAYSFHPGAIYTEGVAGTIADPDNHSAYMEMRLVDKDRKPIPGGLFEWKNIEQGAATHVVAAFDPTLKAHNGAYLSDCKLANDQASPFALDKVCIGSIVQPLSTTTLTLGAREVKCESIVGGQRRGIGTEV